MNATVIRFQVRKIEGRKKLAHTIGEVLGFEPEYDGTPTFAYHIGDCVLGRDWTLTTDRLSDGRVEFPWFTTVPDKTITDAASVLIAAMIAYAKTATRINAKPVEAVNENYAMRCWLLRLGLIGPDTKQVRRELLRHLEGNAAWKNPPHNTEK